MKNIFSLIMLSVLLAGCGDEQPDVLSGNQLENVIYTLEDSYDVSFNGMDVKIFGVIAAFGTVNEEATALLLTPNRQACGTRMIITYLSSNNYKMRIGASEQSGEHCGEVRGDFHLTLTGAKTATVEYLGQSDDFF